MLDTCFSEDAVSIYFYLYKLLELNLKPIEQSEKDLWIERKLHESYTFGFDSFLVIGAWKRSKGSVTDQSWNFAGKSTLHFHCNQIVPQSEM